MEHLLPIVATTLVLGPVAAWAFSHTPIGRAVTRRLGDTGASDERVLDLQDELERVHEQLLDQDQRIEDLQDRLDFTERLLANPDREQSEPKIATPV